MGKAEAEAAERAKAEAEAAEKAKSEAEAAEKARAEAAEKVDACDNLAWQGHFLLNKLPLPIVGKPAWEVVARPDKVCVLWRKDGQLRISRSKNELKTKVRDFDETQVACVTDLYHKFDKRPVVSWQDGDNTISFH